MGERATSIAPETVTGSEFWDALAPYHAEIENNYLDLPSIRRITKDLLQPVLVVGGGQGLIVAELRESGLQCDGVDLSAEMVRYAKLRRGITLIHADARSLPFTDRAYGTVIYATGVIDFIADEEAISLMLKEGRRIVKDSGRIFVAFYRMSAAQERVVKRIGLLHGHALALKRSLELNLLSPSQMIAWVAKNAGVGYVRATILLLWLSARCTRRERSMTFKMQRIFRRMSDPTALINAAAEQQPYRNEAEIRNLFERLAIPIKQLDTFSSCFVARIQ